MIVKSLRKRLEGLLESARRKQLSYASFFRLLAFTLNPNESPGESENIVLRDILEEIRGLGDEVARAQDNLLLMKGEVERLGREGYRPFLVDCLGLPEVYEIFVKITEKCKSPLTTSIWPYVNFRALTSEFKKTYKGQVFRSPTMLEIAKKLGASLYKSPDKTVHEELGKPMKLDDLLKQAESRLKSMVDGLANDAMRAQRAFIISDHGYDVHFNPPDKYYLGHGRESRLAKIAPLIIVEC
jgi:hypothetical protein